LETVKSAHSSSKAGSVYAKSSVAPDKSSIADPESSDEEADDKSKDISSAP